MKRCTIRVGEKKFKFRYTKNEKGDSVCKKCPYFRIANNKYPNPSDDSIPGDSFCTFCGGLENKGEYYLIPIKGTLEEVYENRISDSRS